MTTLPELLAARAAAEPDAVAWIDADGGALTFGEWSRRANALAHGLRKRALARGERVGLLFGGHDWVAYAVAYCGVLAAGGVAVPVPDGLPADRVRAMLDHCGATHVLRAADVPDIAAAGGDGPVVDGPVVDGPVPGDLAQILYTSGTTGTPKGVGASHANLTHGHLPAPRRRAFAHSRHFVHAFPIGTNAGQLMLVNALTARPAAVSAGRFDADRFCALVERHRAGTVFLVPSMAIDLLNSGAHSRHDLSSVLLLNSSAAALPPAVAAALTSAFPAATVVNFYTSTEAVPASTAMVYDPDRPASLGRATGDDLRITGEDGQPLPAGETGEVWLRAPAAQRSYYRDPDASAAVFRPGWTRMGDLGYLDADGYLYLVDRDSDVIKSGGLKVSTLQVEAALYEHPAVAEAAVLGVPHPVMGTAPAAAVVLRSAVDTGALRAFLAGRLAPHEVPGRIAVLDALPRNDTGKVLKRELRAHFTAAAPGPSGPGPATPTEQALASIWRDVLRVREVGAHDDFFTLGGDSLAATQLAALASARFGVDVPVSVAFDRPTLAAQAGWIATQRPAVENGPAESGGRPCLSALQEYFLRWMHETAEPRAVSAVSAAVRIHEPLDRGALLRALHALADRHAALRTVFAAGEPRVLDTLEPAVTVVEGVTAGEAGALARAALERPFDIAHGPLFRALLATVDPDDHVLALGASHLVFDGWSMGVLLRELGLLYSAYRAGRDSPLRPLPADEAEVHGWARAQWPRTREYWSATLAGAPAALEPFPGRQPADRYTAASLDLDLPPDAADRLRAAAAARGATAFMVAAACWVQVLARWAGAPEVVLLSPVPGRVRPEHEALVGCFVQPLLLRVAAGPAPSLDTVLPAVRAAVLGAMEHQFAPYEELSRAIPDPAWFRYDTWGDGAHLPGLDSTEFPLPRGLMFDWPLPAGARDRSVPELALAERAGGALTGALVYNRRAFDRTTVEQLATRFTTTLADLPEAE